MMTADRDIKALVTTDIWREPARVENSYFLGLWCFLSSDDENKARSLGRVIEYHWNDREKLESDFYYLQSLNERLLDELYIRLNQLHGVDESKQYWRILLGYWLNIYTAVLFDRWSSLKQVVQDGVGWETDILPINHASLAANDTSEFITLAAESSKWNHYVFALLIEYVDGIKCSFLKIAPSVEADYGKPPSGDSFARRIIKSALSKIEYLLKRDDNFFFISTYLPSKTKVKLELMLKQLPLPRFGVENSIASSFDQKRRQWSLPIDACTDEFEVIARRLLPTFLPRIFLENYQELVLRVHDIPWPRSPKVIFTANCHFADDIFKAWAARHVACGSRLVICEHGGFGPGSFSGCHSYELSVADVYLSTGWNDEKHKNVKPVGHFRKKLKKIKLNSTGKALLVCGIMPRFSFDIRAMMLSSQVLDYFEDQFCFVDALPRNIQNKILVRLVPQDYGWKQRERWLDRHPTVQFDDGRQSMLDTAARCRLFIGTYMATTYIESLVSNIPTVMFWNPSHWETNPEAQPYFDKMKDVGIFHESAEMAAHHISNIWEDIPSWWQSDEVQSARKSFCDRYAATPPDIDKRLMEILLEEAGRSTIRASR